MAVPEIVDVHVHLCRDVAQEKVVFPKPGCPDEWYWGNPQQGIPYMDKEGISHLFVMNYMDTNRMMETRLSRMKGASEAQIKEAEEQMKPEMAERVGTFNTWSCELGKKQPRFVSFVSVDIGVFYDEKAMMRELEDKIKAGTKGIKIHPGLSRFLPGDKRMYPLYDMCQQRGVAILSDSGAAGGVHNGVVYGEPNNFIPVFKDFPRLKFIMAHLLSAFWDERIEIAKEFPNIYFDTAGGFHSNDYRSRDGYRSVPLEDGARFLKKIGTHRILFGSDGPGSEPRNQFTQIMRLPLTDQEKRQILGENAKQFMGIK